MSETEACTITNPAASSSETTQWPEERNPNTSYLKLLYKKWTYSYMSPIISKGSRQTLEDGSHLSESDLFPVPRTMESKYLSKKFR